VKTLFGEIRTTEYKTAHVQFLEAGRRQCAYGVGWQTYEDLLAVAPN